jgi:hypothetical protein
MSKMLEDLSVLINGAWSDTTVEKLREEYDLHYDDEAEDGSRDDHQYAVLEINGAGTSTIYVRVTHAVNDSESHVVMHAYVSEPTGLNGSCRSLTVHHDSNDF